MNTCDRSIQLSSYHDGELPPEGRREVEAHLRECPACARELAQLRSLSDVLATGGAAISGLSPDAARRLRALGPAAAGAGNLRLVKWLSAAAAIILSAAVWQLYQAKPAPASTDLLAQIGQIVQDPEAAVTQDQADSGAAVTQVDWIVDNLPSAASAGRASDARNSTSTGSATDAAE